MSSVTGNKIKLSIFGESHGEAIGCVIDGFPAGIKIDTDSVYADMARRAPGKDKTATPRLEKDIPRVLSGMLGGVTTGAPIAMIIENINARSSDYDSIDRIPRPSHSDYPAFVKYGGSNDVRGGGHFSGRLTAPLVFAGSLAKQALAQKGVFVGAHIKQIGSVCDKAFDPNCITFETIKKLASSSFSLIDESRESAMRSEIEKYRSECDSIGGIIECAVIGVPAGVGGNMFDTVESRLSYVLFGIPAVKGVQFGLGFDFANKNAAAVNDGYCIKDGAVSLLSNNNGGVLGGITNGAPIVFSAAIKPTPSISKEQDSVDLDTMQNKKLVVKGRHDPCIVPRAVPVVEAAAAFVILDMMI